MEFDPVKDIPDLSGKVVLVTGGNVGIGASIVKGLVPHNAHIYICARRSSSAEALVEEIRQKHPSAKLSILSLDLSSFDSIKQCAAAFNAQSERLDLLFLNAGIAATAPALTKEGYEQQFGVNHVGHALLTQLLLPKLLQTRKASPDADVRIMLTSSRAGHEFGAPRGLALDRMREPGPLASGMHRYGHSKLANMLFARALAQRYPAITSTSFHPGVVKTEIWGKANGMRLLNALFAPFVFLGGISADKGAVPGLWTATAKTGLSSGVENGRYYPPGMKAYDGKYSNSQPLIDELWEWTTQELAQHGGPGWAEAA